jgi:hypothetical protein
MEASRGHDAGIRGAREIWTLKNSERLSKLMRFTAALT